MSIVCENLKTPDGVWVSSFSSGGVQYRTRFCSLWYSLVYRCKPDGRFQNKQPAYKGCTMSDEFKSYQLFCNWADKQIGSGIVGYELDKDILFFGNKNYSSDCCVFVPKELNLFLTSSNRCRGKYPQGVSKSRNRYLAHISIAGVSQHIGSFLNVEDAYLAYKERKGLEARRWVSRLESEEYVVDSRVIERMKIWELP